MRRLLRFLENRLGGIRTQKESTVDRDPSQVTQFGVPFARDSLTTGLSSQTLDSESNQSPDTELFQVNKPPKKPYLYAASGRLFPTSTARHYVRVRPYYGHADPVQALLPASREFIQAIVKGERRPENQELWSMLCLKNTPTHIIHMGYVNESRTANWDLVYLAVHLHGHPMHYASSIAIELGEFLTKYLLAQAEDPDGRRMTVNKPGSSAAQVFWVALLFVKYRALMLGDQAIGREDRDTSRET